MTRFAHAHAAGSDWRSICDSLLEQLADRPDVGHLAFLYADHSLAADGDRIIDYLRSHSGVPHWVGTVGLAVCSTGWESYEEPAAAVLVTDWAEDDFRVLPGCSENPAEMLEAIADWRARDPGYFAVTHGDPSNPNTPELIETLANELQGGFLVGGLTSSEGIQAQFADQVTGGGISGVLLSGRLKIATGLSQGCSLIGHKHTVSACQRNIIQKLDERPALDVLKQDIGEVLARDLTRIGGYIFVALPIPGSDTGDYLVRNLVGVDPNEGLVAVGDLLQDGMALQFAKRDAQTAREDLQRMVRDVKARIDGEPKGALYHSCLGRGRHLFGDNSAELQLIQDELGDVPLVGFYANGEISHHRLYGYTGVLTVFS
jgi:small ligand-binding sensory domain FIST